jgi:hypothetical protein
VAVDAQLGVVGEVGAELQEERSEIGIDRIDVELVDHTGGLHDPRVGIPLDVAAALSAEQVCLLLRSPDEQHPFFGGEPGKVLMHDIVFALPLGEIHPRHPLVAGEAVHRGAEGFGDLPQWCGRGDR